MPELFESQPVGTTEEVLTPHVPFIGRSKVKTVQEPKKCGINDSSPPPSDIATSRSELPVTSIDPSATFLV